jgi:hypothetical protein
MVSRFRAELDLQLMQFNNSTSTKNGDSNMKKIALLAVFVLALAAVRSDSSVGVPNNGSYSSAGARSNGAMTVHFTAAYQNNIGGFFTCAGERITRTAPNPFTKDSEDCTMTDLSTLPPGTYVGNPFLIVNGVSYNWFSDYDAKTANSVTVIVTDNGDGTGHVAAVAYY